MDRSAARSSRTSCSFLAITKDRRTIHRCLPTSTAFRRRRLSSTCGQTTGFCNLSQYLGVRPVAAAVTASSRGKCSIPPLAICKVAQPYGHLPGNLIPNSLISPQARSLLALFPAPNSRRRPTPEQLHRRRIGSIQPERVRRAESTGWQRPTLNVFGRYSQSYFSVSGAPGLGNAGGERLRFGRTGGQLDHSQLQRLAIGATKTFSQTWLADFRFGWFKYNPHTQKYFAGPRHR